MVTRTRTSLDRDLNAVHQQLGRLGDVSEQTIDLAIAALINRTEWPATHALASKANARRLRRELERLCVTTIATQQSNSRDLRFLIAAAHISIDLERIAAHAHGIARIALRLIALHGEIPVLDIQHMHRLCSRMLKQALLALDRHDANMAKHAASLDDEIDAVQAQYRRILLTYSMEKPDAATIEESTYLLWVAHDIERIADHVTNICERIAFVATGDVLELNP